MTDNLFKIADDERILELFDKETYTVQGDEWRRLLCARVIQVSRELTAPKFDDVSQAIKIALREAEPTSLDHITDVATATAFSHTGWSDQIPKPKHRNWVAHIEGMTGGRRVR